MTNRDVSQIGRFAMSEIEELREMASGMRIDLQKLQQVGWESNLLGIRAGKMLISRRTDSRTVFVHDNSPRRQVGYVADEHELAEACREICGVLEIPWSEVVGPMLLSEMSRAASMGNGGEFEMEEEQVAASVARLERSVDSLPVWSSGLTLRLADRGRIGFLQAHWPDLSLAVLKEASLLARFVEEGFQPADAGGAKPESLEAGIVHSPAAGVLMDIYPAIRVIYAGEQEGVGRKLVLHVDRAGNQLPTPRQFDLPYESPEDRSEPDAGYDNRKKS